MTTPLNETSRRERPDCTANASPQPPRGGAVDASDAVLVADGRLHPLPTGPRALLTTSFLDMSARLDLGLFLGKLAFADPASLDGLSVRAWLAEALRTDAARQVIAVL